MAWGRSKVFRMVWACSLMSRSKLGDRKQKWWMQRTLAQNKLRNEAECGDMKASCRGLFRAGSRDLFSSQEEMKKEILKRL